MTLIFNLRAWPLVVFVVHTFSFVVLVISVDTPYAVMSKRRSL